MTNTKKLTRLRGSNPTSTADLLFRLELLGCTVERTRHLKVLVDGKCRATLASTPSDPRALLNAVSSLRRVGIDVRSMKVT